jgi:hypothetical protein
VSAGRAVKERTTPAVTPPMEKSNEAEPEQLDTARQQGGAYGAALRAMAEEDGAAVAEAGNFVVALVNEQAEGMYAPDDGGLVWREAPQEANWVPGTSRDVLVDHLPRRGRVDPGRDDPRSFGGRHPLH